MNPCLSQIPEHKSAHFATMDIDCMHKLAVISKSPLCIKFLLISFLSFINYFWPLKCSTRFFHVNKLMHFKIVYFLEIFIITVLSFCALWQVYIPSMVYLRFVWNIGKIRLLLDKKIQNIFCNTKFFWMHANNMGPSC